MAEDDMLNRILSSSLVFLLAQFLSVCTYICRHIYMCVYVYECVSLFKKLHDFSVGTPLDGAVQSFLHISPE